MSKKIVSIFLCISIIFTCFISIQANAVTHENCYASHNDEGAHYYISYLKPSYNNNRLLVKIPMSQISIETYDTRTGYIGIGFNNNNVSQNNQTSFVDVSVQFKNNTIYTYVYGKHVFKDKSEIGIEESYANNNYKNVLGTYTNNKVDSSLMYVDLMAWLSRESGLDYINVTYTCYDKNWNTTTTSYKRDITGWFDYNKTSNVFNVNPYQFTSLLMTDSSPTKHNDGTYLSGSLLLSKYDNVSGQIPFKTEEGVTTVNRVCTNNLDGPTAIAENSTYLCQAYSFSIHNNNPNFEYTGPTNDTVPDNTSNYGTLISSPNNNAKATLFHRPRNGVSVPFIELYCSTQSDFKKVYKTVNIYNETMTTEINCEVKKYTNTARYFLSNEVTPTNKIVMQFTYKNKTYTYVFKDSDGSCDIYVK